MINPPQRVHPVEYLSLGATMTALALAFGLWLGLVFLWSPREGLIPGAATTDLATQAQIDENHALATRIADLRAAAKTDVCTLTPQQMAPLGLIDRSARVAPLPGGDHSFKGSLVALADQATVMVLAFHGKGGDQGSGFFISHRLIVTNDHVIAGAEPGKIFVVSRSLGKALPATIVASTGSTTIGTPDFALLSVARQEAVQPLVLTASVAQLQPVVAAGYPGIVVQADRGFAALLHGNADAVPSVVLTEGRISAIETSPAGTRILPHTALVAPGNSGGPLIDQCGRVVGVDTFIAASAADAVHINYALEAATLDRFLTAHDVNPTMLSTVCSGPAGVMTAGSPPVGSAGPAAP
ncbi:MAG: serine protease [Acidiphilium sp.]|nr:serine protease [Acidiphilium sp.]MDD4936401.1 serine protease [Acidiphilium sp.]